MSIQKKQVFNVKKKQVCFENYFKKKKLKKKIQVTFIQVNFQVFN
jgi:hypothetical protein